MDRYYRILDANMNRTCEGLRVCEDYLRFNNNDKILSEEFKLVRHNIRQLLDKSMLISKRDSLNDVGLKSSQENNLDSRQSLKSFLIANITRAQEGARVIEETLKLLSHYTIAKKMEGYRFTLYQLEKKLLMPFNKRIYMLNEFGIYGITAEKYSRGRDNFNVVKQMLEAGVRIIQYREKEKSATEKLRETLKLRQLTNQYDALFIIDDDIDITILCNADGVHLGQDDIPCRSARKLLGDDKIIGISTHSKEQALKAIDDGADYIGVGPIYKTNTKDNVCPPVGLSYLSHVSENLSIPFVAIGGIKEDNINEVLNKGGKCICLVTGIVSSDNIKLTIENLNKKIIKKEI